MRFYQKIFARTEIGFAKLADRFTTADEDLSSFLQESITNKMPISYIACTVNSSMARGFQEKQQTIRLSTLTSPY
jgi:hypothetical protein